MPSREEVSYFGAGPAPLPTSVLEAGSKAFLNFNDTGLSLAEISHRSPTANKILADTKASLTTLLDIPDNYEILFMQGGGSGEFSAVVHNLVSAWIGRRKMGIEEELREENPDEDPDALDKKVLSRVQTEVVQELKLDYLVTGSWSLKASQEAARLIGPQYVNVAVDARRWNDGKFGKIPAESMWKLSKQNKGPAIVYYCDNETVDGVEFQGFPKGLECEPGKEEEKWVVADMSSNFLSRKVDVSKYAVIFGGAQKNVGVTGVTIVIARKSLLPPHIETPSPSFLHKLKVGGMPGPVVLDYATIAKNNSLYNTLSIFDVWIAGQVMANLVTAYGEKKVSGQEEIADRKAKMIYETLDKHSGVYSVVPNSAVRSRMNICFRVHGGDAEKEKAFLTGAEERMLQGLKGHRSVGGIRASNYNAVPLQNAEKLVRYLEDYAQGQ